MTTVAHGPLPNGNVPIQGASYRVPRLHSDANFDPEKHLCFREPARKYTMTEIGLGEQGISPIAVVEPFPLCVRTTSLASSTDCTPG